MKRYHIINRLIETGGYQTYLEIGVYKPKRCFDKIRCRQKISVDPNPKGKVTHRMTSDEFFERPNSGFDIVFVDGLHTYEQAEKDIRHALLSLNTIGSIVVHDCNPPTEWHQREVRGYGDWNGTVWKAFAELRMTREDLVMYTVDCDWGVGVIELGTQHLFPEMPLVYSTLEQHRKQLLNLISPREFLDANK